VGIFLIEDGGGWRRSNGHPPNGPVKTQITSLVETVKTFRMEQSRWPASLEELCVAPMPEEEPWLDRLPKDPWNSPYDYRIVGDEPVVRSAGPDGVLDTEDDISSDDPQQPRGTPAPAPATMPPAAPD
jgi:hypothetical protein